ncbi:MAG TPA: phosphopantetheine-binding protein [Polyangia bacterium]|jgi:acyl carrier protein
MDERERIRTKLATLLADRGDTRPFADDEALLTSARIDSVDVVEMVAFLEASFGVDFAARDFDPAIFDSVDSIIAFVAELPR